MIILQKILEMQILDQITIIIEIIKKIEMVTTKRIIIIIPKITQIIIEIQIVETITQIEITTEIIEIL